MQSLPVIVSVERSDMILTFQVVSVHFEHFAEILTNCSVCATHASNSELCYNSSKVSSGESAMGSFSAAAWVAWHSPGK